MNPSAPGAEVPSFFVDVGGIGGTVRREGIYFDSMLLSTVDGVPCDASDARNILFAGGAEELQFEAGAPLLFSDITVSDPALPEGDPNKILTLNGAFGMNCLLAAIEIFTPSGGGIPDIWRYRQVCVSVHGVRRRGGDGGVWVFICGDSRAGVGWGGGFGWIGGAASAVKWAVSVPERVGSRE